MSRWIAMLAVLLFSGCALLQEVVQAPEVRITDAGLEKAGLFEQVLRFDLRLDNPNPVSLPLAGMRYTLELGGIELGRGEQLEAVTLPARGTANWPVRFRVNSLKLLQGVLEGGSLQDMDYRIYGDFLLREDSPIGPIPFERSGRIGGSN